eukprot:6207182-Pleurochrysis_carterae.AAC.5
MAREARKPRTIPALIATVSSACERAQHNVKAVAATVSRVMAWISHVTCGTACQLTLDWSPNHQIMQALTSARSNELSSLVPICASNHSSHRSADCQDQCRADGKGKDRACTISLRAALSPPSPSRHPPPPASTCPRPRPHPRSHFR